MIESNETQSVLDNLLLRLDRQEGDYQVVSAQEIREWPEGLFQTLCHEGLLVPTTPNNLFTCVECDEDHTEEVIAVESPAGSPLFSA